MQFTRSSYRLPRRFPFIVLSMMVFIIAAMASAVTAQPADAGNLPGTQWQLVSYGTPDAETPVVEGSTITLEFPAANQLAGHAGCNQYSASYGVEEADMVVTDVVSTLIACEDEAISEQEAIYLVALETVSSYVLTEENLEIWYDNDQQRLSFVPADTLDNPLLDTSWELVSYGPADDQTDVITDSQITLSFPSSSQIEGNGGCNGYGGVYAVEEDTDTITITDVVSTLIACEEDAVTQQESTYFQALNAAERYEIDGSTLIIYTAEEEELHFMAINPLLNTQWQLVSYGEAGSETEVVGETDVTLTFIDDNMLEGHGGCNGFGGTYTVAGEALTVNEINRTEMACEDPNAMQQEIAYFEALETATGFEMAEDELVIFYGDEDEQLNFVADHEEDDTTSSSSN